LNISAIADPQNRIAYILLISLSEINLIMTNKLILFSFLILFAFSTPSLAQGMHPQAQIDFVKNKIIQQEQPYLDAYHQLLAYADSALTRSPRALADFDVPGFYIDAKMHRQNSRILQSDAFDAYVCALAFRLGGERHYADKAKEFLLAWANTNKKYSNYDGSLVMAYSGTAMVNAASLLMEGTDWGPTEQEAVKGWVREVYQKACHEIRNRSNNWADWGRLGALLSASLLKDKADIQENIRLIKSDWDHKFAEDGHMPEEIRREANGIWYTYFSLAPITAACWVVLQEEGTDFFDVGSDQGKSLKAALDYLLRYSKNPEEWKWFDNPNPPRVGRWPGNLFEAMHELMEKPGYAAYVEQGRPWIYPEHHFAWTFPTLMKPMKSY
jgi:hypothetical protein